MRANGRWSFIKTESCEDGGCVFRDRAIELKSKMSGAIERRTSVCRSIRLAALATLVAIPAIIAVVVAHRGMRPGTEAPRLAGGVRPLHYRLRLKPDLNGSTFEGRVRIRIAVNEGHGREFALHASGLRVSNVRFKDVHGTPINITSSSLSRESQLLKIITAEPLSPGEYLLKINYSGSLRDRIVGFYRSTYKNSTGHDRPIATSKFEPTYARQAFPCFDEPAMKAKFTVELVAPQGYIALSNMDQNGPAENMEDGNLLFKFSESVPMSTYLACFIICDFKNKGGKIDNADGTQFDFKVYAPETQIDNIDFAKDIGMRVTDYYIKYFDISYPLPKLDMIAIPDFVSGAMEHWGLVTYRETNLLHNESTTSVANKQNIARVIAHEVSHMWFGNLVTMKWWNDLWLNEGFASYMQYKALDEVEKDWKMMEQFLTANTHSILSLDGTLNSHPIVQTVDTPDQITAIFDSITYNKGAAIIRMLEDFIGNDKFKEGVTNYLRKHAYGNTVTQDLLDELQNVLDPDDVNVTHVMDTWTKQMGLPVVNIMRIVDENVYELTQKRFLANPDEMPSTKYKWSIPITYLLADGTKGRIWFPDNVDSIKIPIQNGNDIIKLNNDQVGYYRVNYDDVMWEYIKNTINPSAKFSTSDRAHLLNDVFTLAYAEEVSYNLALDLSKYLKEETDYVPWSVASTQFSSLQTLMSTSTSLDKFKMYVRNLLDSIYTELENPGNDHVKKLQQSSIYGLACSMNHENCLNEAKLNFENWLENPENSIDPNLRSTYYYYGVQESDDNKWLKLWEKFQTETDAQEKTKIMSALAASKSQTILKMYLDLAWNENYIRSQDHLDVIQRVSSNPVGTSLAWDHVRDNWTKLVDKFTLNSRTLGTTIPAITKTFATEERLREMEEFFAKYPEAGAGATAREQAIETVKNNINWVRKYESTISNWLENNANY